MSTPAVLFTALVICLLLRVPIGISLGIGTLMAILSSGVVSTRYLAQSMTTALDSFPLMAVPFFILAGEIMGTGGISKRLLHVANAWLGHITGGMALVTVAACMFFAAISGSAPATVAAIGGLVIPEMLRQGYDKKFTCGLVASAGSLGVVIPPSIPMVLYGVAVSVSISDLFIAGIIPGLMIGAGLMLYAYFYCKKKNYTFASGKVPMAERFSRAWEAKWALLVPVVILGGIYAGIFTPTEAAAVAVFYGFVISMFVYKELKFSDLAGVFSRSALTTATVLIVIGTATAFGRIMTLEKIPAALTAAINAFSSSPLVVMALLMLFLIFVGCIMDAPAAIVILAPLLMPVAAKVGVDPIHFGVAMVVNLSLGFITPPLGLNLFVTCGIANISLDAISKAVLPFLAVMAVILILIVTIPGLSLFLPGLGG
ncbi:MAG: TRAP transporter large permease [Deltaproteobacteria bacterium]|nr:TRAP transporter large permease [Deltaproteobacteria bacterium]